MSAQYFQPSFSDQFIPSYAPLPMESIAGGLQLATDRYEKSLQAADIFETGVANLRDQIDPANLPAVEGMFAEDMEFLEGLSTGEIDYRDAEPILRRRARQRQQELQPYLHDSALRRQTREDLKRRFDEGDIDRMTYSHELRQLQEAGPLQRDPETGDWQYFQGSVPPSTIDVQDMLNEYMRGFATQKDVTDALSTAQGRFLSRFTMETRGANDIQMAAVARMMADPQVMDYLRYSLERQGINPDEAIRTTEVDTIVDPETGEEVAVGQEHQFTRLHQELLRQAAPQIIKHQMHQRTASDRVNPEWKHQMENFMPSGLSSTVTVGVPGNYDLASPARIANTVRENEKKVDHVLEEFTLKTRNPEGNSILDWEIVDGRIVTSNPVVQLPDGEYHNFEHDINLANARMKMFELENDRLRNFDQRARRDAGLIDSAGNSLLSPQEEADIERVLNSSFRSWREKPSQGGSGQYYYNPGQVSYEDWLQTRHYEKSLEKIGKTNPAYKDYLETLKARSEGASIDRELIELRDPKDRQYMNNHFRNMGPGEVILDGFTGSILDEKERENINFERTHYMGSYIKADDQVIAMYREFVEDGDKKIPKMYQIPAPNGLYDVLMRQGNMDGAVLPIYRQLANLHDDPTRGEPSVDIRYSLIKDENTAIPVTGNVEILPRDVQTQTGQIYQLNLQFAGKGEDGSEQVVHDRPTFTSQADLVRYFLYNYVIPKGKRYGVDTTELERVAQTGR